MTRLFIATTLFTGLVAGLVIGLANFTAARGPAGIAGQVIAQANLGEMLSRGEGIPHDGILAWAWLCRAAGGGNAWAED